VEENDSDLIYGTILSRYLSGVTDEYHESYGGSLCKFETGAFWQKKKKKSKTLTLEVAYSIIHSFGR
jgi:hypothetical protein